jgi:hypothetical protein
MKLSSTRNVMKSILSITQVVFATFTLYKTRGGQVQEYGYAAYGLTVTVFAVMSLLNLCGNILCPQYSVIYMVESEIMHEALKCHGWFEGVVGCLDENRRDPLRDVREPGETKLSWRDLLWLPACLIPAALSLTVNGVMTGFQPGNSTFIQRLVTMGWMKMLSRLTIFTLDFPPCLGWQSAQSLVFSLHVGKKSLEKHSLPK